MPINIELTKTQKYIEWLKNMIYIDTLAQKARGRIIRRGEVYKCNLGMGIGSEENKERPCVVLQYDAGNTNSPNTIIAPITHSSSHLPIVVPVDDKYDAQGVMILDGHVLLGNVVCVSKARLGNFIVKLTDGEMLRVDEALSISIDLKRHYDKLNRIHNDKLQYISKLQEKVAGLEAECAQQKVLSDKVEAICLEVGCNNFDELVEEIRRVHGNPM